MGLYLASIHQMAPPGHTSDKQACYLFIDACIDVDLYLSTYFSAFRDCHNYLSHSIWHGTDYKIGLRLSVCVSLYLSDCGHSHGHRHHH